ncbi:MAG: type II toxin-antitoxin system Phd/YefM family antitoxin [Pseudomonadota bacterium]
MQQINIHEAKSQLSRLVELAAHGEEIIIAKAGKPIARLVAYRPHAKPRKPGLLRGKVRIRKDFDAPLPEGLFSTFDDVP